MTQLDLYQKKDTYFIITTDNKLALYTKSEELFFGNHNAVFTRLEEVNRKQPKMNWMMVSGTFLEKEMPKTFLEYAKLCEEDYYGEPLSS